MRRPRKMGLGSAYREAFAAGLALGYDVMIQIDADLSHDPADLPRLLAAIETGADLAVGSRYVAGGTVPNWPRERLFLSTAGNRYAAWALGLDVRRLHCRLSRRFARRCCGRSTSPPTHSSGYGFQVEMTYRVARVGGRIVEVPICFTDRVLGTSKMSWRIIGEAAVRVSWWGIRDRVLPNGRRGRVASNATGRRSA